MKGHHFIVYNRKDTIIGRGRHDIQTRKAPKSR